MYTYHVSILHSNTPESRVSNYTVVANNFETRNNFLTFFLTNLDGTQSAAAQFYVDNVERMSVVSAAVIESNDTLVKLVPQPAGASVEPAGTTRVTSLPIDFEAARLAWDALFDKMAAGIITTEEPVDESFFEDVEFDELSTAAQADLTVSQQFDSIRRQGDIMINILTLMKQHSSYGRYSGKSGLY